MKMLQKLIESTSLCPLNASIPIQVNGIIPVGPSDVGNIPSIAYSIPDFEGQAILRIFSNTTESQIACFSAVLTNGASFAQLAAIASILGIFTAVALFSSLVAAMYGTDLSSTRSHYAHSLSIFVVFSVFHHIYFTGALSMNWPSVLVAFWANYAWSAGLIYSEKMQNSINQFLGSNRGNISIVGAAAAGTEVSNVGGGYDISQLYKREYIDVLGERGAAGVASGLKAVSKMLAKRSSSAASTDYPWHGSPVRPGLPLPGNYSGFAGTLAQEGIPASNAFMTGFLWFLALSACIPVLIGSLKLAVEGLSRIKMLEKNKFVYFRTHWLRFAAFAMLRAVYIAFYMMIFLTLFQFTFGGSAGVLAIAAVVFLIFLLSMSGAAGYALYCQFRGGKFTSKRDRLLVVWTKPMFCLPWLRLRRESQLEEEEKDSGMNILGSIPWRRISYGENPNSDESIHDDEDYLKKFGWLYARFRRTRWYSFAIWLLYEFIRACFFGGAAGHPLTQVFGILAVEFIALVAIVWMRPFEATRLNALMVYLLGFSKVASVALSAAFDPSFGLSRILTTVIGIVIIVIQGVLTIVLLIAIFAGAISTYMSITRDRDVEDFTPRSWRPMRERYLAHVSKAALDLPPPPRPPTPSTPEPEEPKGPSFNVVTVKRYPKIEDEDIDNRARYMQSNASSSILNSSHSIRSQLSYSNLPYGAMAVQASWSSLELGLDGGGGSRKRSQNRRCDSPANGPDRDTVPVGIPSRTPTPGRLRNRSIVLDDIEDVGEEAEGGVEQVTYAGTKSASGRDGVRG